MNRDSILCTAIRSTILLIVSASGQAADDDFQANTDGAGKRPLPRQDLIIREVLGAEPVATDIESMVFGKDVAGAKARLDVEIAKGIEEACRGYELPESIRHRIELAAQSDKMRLFREIEDLTRALANAGGDARKRGAVMSAVQDLRKRQAKLLGRQSFFEKSRISLLASIPSINPELTVDKLKRSRHRSNVEQAIQAMDKNGDLSVQQSSQLMDLLFEQTLPEEPFEFLDLQLVKYRIGILPRETLQPMFDEAQWERAARILTRFQESGRYLVNDGVIKGDLVPLRESLETPAAKVVRPTVPARVFVKNRPQPVPQQPHDKQDAIVDPALIITRHRANIRAAVDAIEQKVPLRPVQRKALAKQLFEEIPPPKVFGKFDDLVIQYAFSQIPDERLKPLFDDAQWPMVLAEFARIDQLRPLLIAHGLIGQDSIRKFSVPPAKSRPVIQAADALSPSNLGKE